MEAGLILLVIALTFIIMFLILSYYFELKEIFKKEL